MALLYRFSVSSLSLSPSTHRLCQSSPFPSAAASLSSWSIISLRLAPSQTNSLTWMLIRNRYPATILKAAVSSGNNSDWDTDGATYSAAFHWNEIVNSWGLPVAIGILFGSFMARKPLIFIISFSFVAFTVARKVLKTRDETIADAFLRYLLNAVFKSKSKMPRLVHNAICELGLIFRTLTMYMHSLVISFPGHLQSAAPQEQKNEELMSPLKLKNSSRNMKEDNRATLDSAISDIRASILKLESVIKSQDDQIQNVDPMKLENLKGNLSSLKGSIKSLSQRRDVIDKLRQQETSNKFVVRSLNSEKSNEHVRESGKTQDKSDNLTVTRLEYSPEKNLQSRIASNEQADLGVLPNSKDVFSPNRHRLDNDNKFPKELVECKGKTVSESQGHGYRNVDFWIERDASNSTNPQHLSGSDLKLHDVKHSESGLKSTTDGQTETLVDSLKPVLNSDKENLWIDVPHGIKNHNVTVAIASEMKSCISNIPESAEDEGETQDPRPQKLTAESSDKILRNDSNLKCKVNGSTSKRQGESANVFESRSENDGTGQQADQNESDVQTIDFTRELPFIREDLSVPKVIGLARSTNVENFQRLMSEGEKLLSNARAGLTGKLEVGEAEIMLYNAADIFASAVALRPSSIEAYGFWGNTLLVHGELKLKLSREFRFMLSSIDAISPYHIRQNVRAEPQGARKLVAIEKNIPIVCEECEELLVMAGRKYRAVLSIDNNDIRALYNWGLALCYRAELAASRAGQDSSEAADRIYLAAIDKFEAMMGVSRRYTPAAMLKWGLALKDRSRLRPMNSAERIDLLKQAKQLFEDALRLQPSFSEIYGIFAACSIELKELEEKSGQRTKRSNKSMFSN